MTDTTASILEAIVSEAKGENSSITPTDSLFQGTPPPIHPLVRCCKSYNADGPARPGSMVRFRLPNAIDSGVHILETVWLEFTIAHGLTSVSANDLAGVRAIERIEVRTSEGVLIEDMRGEDILLYARVNMPSPMFALSKQMASTDLSDEVVQVPLPLCILKDSQWFPYLALDNGLEIRLVHSNTTLSTIQRSSARIWLEGYAIPSSAFSLYQNLSFVMPITTLHSQTRVFAKGSAPTQETFLLEDPRDLQEIMFVFRNLEETSYQYYGPGNAVYDSLDKTWVEIGTDKVVDPLRSQIVRTIGFFHKHARVPELSEGIHIIPLSNSPQPILTGYTTPGLMAYIQPKVNIKFTLNAINRPPGDRLRFEVYVLMLRGQRLRIHNGTINRLDESYPDNVPSKSLPDPYSEINIDDPGTMSNGNPKERPESAIGYLPLYRNITHEPFSKLTRSFALAGSHAFGDLIVARLPLETDFLTDLVLRTRLPALPAGYRWVNGIGYSLFKRMTIRHEDVVLFDAPGETLFLIDQQDAPLETRIRSNAIDYGYRSSQAPDIADVSMGLYRELGSTDGYLRIPIPWAFSRDNSLPLPTAALRDRNLEVGLRLGDVQDLIVTLAGDTPTIEERERIREKLRLSETLLDVTGYVLPHSLRKGVMREAKEIRCTQYRIHKFADPEGIMRTVPVQSGMKRLLLTSPITMNRPLGENSYNQITIRQIYSGSAKWYQQTPPPSFFSNWSRWRQQKGKPDIPILCIDNRPGFINAARLPDIRIETSPGNLMVLTETEEFYRIQKGKIGPIYAD